MNITFACPKCDQASRVGLAAGDESLACSHCGLELAIPADAFDGDRVCRCVVCPSTELFTRKDFPQRLGVGIVVAGFAASCVTWALYLPQWTFAVLFATALVDLGLYALVGNSVMCYRCAAEYRGLESPRDYRPFDLETHERHRQQKARQEQASQERARQERARQESAPPQPAPPDDEAGGSARTQHDTAGAS